LEALFDALVRREALLVEMYKVFLVAVVAATLMSAWADAQPSNTRRLCFGGNEVPIEQKLSACTAMIESGQEIPQDRAVAFGRRGLALFEKKDFDRAIADYDQSLALNPKQVTGFINRGNAWQAKGYNNRAIEDYNQAIRLDQKNAIAFYNLGVAYEDKGRWEFDAYVNEGSYEEVAIRCFNLAILLNPKYHQALNNRGDAYLILRQYARAIDDFNQAVQIDTNEPLYFKNRANALRFVGQYERAIADYRKALTLKIDEQMKKEIEGALKELSTITH
jgi:tetratricopeptide (TPR) repeat protein